MALHVNTITRALSLKCCLLHNTNIKMKTKYKHILCTNYKLKYHFFNHHTVYLSKLYNVLLASMPPYFMRKKLSAFLVHFL